MMRIQISWTAVDVARSFLLKILLFSFFLLLCCPWGGSVAANASVADAVALLVWAERDDHGRYAMQISQYDGRRWTEPLRIADGDDEQILPAVGSNDQGDVWVAWTELHGLFGVIRYRVALRGVWSAPATLASNTLSDMAPSVTVDADGQAWMVFSGSDGSQDDIFVARWVDAGWSRPERIHPENNVPDILPRIFRDAGGRPVVQWRNFDGEAYQYVVSRRSPVGWSTPEPARTILSGLGVPGPSASGTAMSGISADNTRAIDALLDNLPPFFQDPTQAVLHLRSGQNITVPLKEE